jgi:hypothetical protein
MLVPLFKDLLRSKQSRNAEEFARAQVMAQGLQLHAASSVLDMLLERSPRDAPALLLRGRVKRLQGNPSAAIADLDRAMQLDGGNGDVHFELALCWRLLGDDSRALSWCERARQVAPDSVQAFFLLAQLRLPGDDYFEVLRRIIDHLKPSTYVEIGVFEGASLRLASSAEAIVGIDPDPRINWVLGPHMKVFKTSSDEFFATHDLFTELGQRRLDLAFIDGMHKFEYAMRDFANLERHCGRHSVVLVHDCYPLDEESAGREPRVSRWSGDVWRLIVLLKKYRPDLLIHTIGTAPTGLAVIQNLNPESTFLLDNESRLREEFLALEYSYLDEEKPSRLNLFPNRWTEIEAMIQRRPV